MTIPTIALNTDPREYAKLANLGNRVVLGLTANVYFTTPAIPVATMQIAVTNVMEGMAKWGPKHNRGSHADLVDLRAKARTLYMLLRAEAKYVQSTAAIAAGNDYAAMATMISTSGFGLKASKHHQGALHKVENLKFVPCGSLNRNQAKMVWDRPLEVTCPVNVKSYVIYRSDTAKFSDAVQVETTSKTEFIDTNNTGAIVTWSYFIVAIGAAGRGAVSDPITITLVP